MLDVKLIKKDFPIFQNVPHLTYLDSAATSLKPQAVIDKEIEYYENYGANILRGIYKISEVATEEYEKARVAVATFIKAKTEEIVFVRNTTEAINLVAYSLGREIVGRNDEVVTTIMEHHSNFVPWQQLCAENSAVLKVINIEDGILNLELDKVVNHRTKILALTYVSNMLGTINPVKEIIARAKKINPRLVVLVDAAQAIPHMPVDVSDLNCDFLAFSGHKMLGPTGVGVLWGRDELLKEMYPFQYGGEMIKEVHLAETSFADPPQKFEAGTPAIAQVIALKEAIRYLEKVGMENVRLHEKMLIDYAIDKLTSRFGEQIKIFGPKDSVKRGGALSFIFKNYHAHDVAQILDEEGICVRAGHHCTMTLHTYLGLNATVRASFFLYNDESDIDKLIVGLGKVEKKLG